MIQSPLSTDLVSIESCSARLLRRCTPGKVEATKTDVTTIAK